MTLEEPVDPGPNPAVAAKKQVIAHGVTVPKLTGKRCRCTACPQRFNSDSVFDRHRVGTYRDRGIHRRCLSTAEMEARGWSRNPDGFWIERRRRAPGLDRARKTGDQQSWVVGQRSPSREAPARAVDVGRRILQESTGEPAWPRP
jgi:hypothetical protein